MLIKKTGYLLASVGALCAALGCGKKDPGPGGTTGSAAAPPAAAPASSGSGSGPAPAAGKPLKVAFAYVGPVGDAGWTFAHDKARKAVEAEFGDKITTSFVENVPEAADAERVIRDMVAQGAGLVFGTTFGYMEPMMKVAADAK